MVAQRAMLPAWIYDETCRGFYRLYGVLSGSLQWGNVGQTTGAVHSGGKSNTDANVFLPLSFV